MKIATKLLFTISTLVLMFGLSTAQANQPAGGVFNSVQFGGTGVPLSVNRFVFQGLNKFQLYTCKANDLRGRTIAIDYSFAENLADARTNFFKKKLEKNVKLDTKAGVLYVSLVDTQGQPATIKDVNCSVSKDEDVIKKFKSSGSY